MVKSITFFFRTLFRLLKLLFVVDGNNRTMSTGKKTIMIIDDHPIIHDGLRTMFEASSPDLYIQESAFTAEEAIRILTNGLPDLAIVDLSLADADGTYFIQKLKSRFPELCMLIYTMSEERMFAERAAVSGARGYVMKTSPPEDLKKAIRILLDGGVYFNDDILERLEKITSGRGKGVDSPFDTLSNREMEVFILLGKGLSAKGIAEKLNISRNTVDTHRINIKNKLNQPTGKALERLAYDVLKNGGLGA
jgi:DNA-binding NarL/FixJ family response regulator